MTASDKAPLKRGEVTMLAQFKEGEIGDSNRAVARTDLPIASLGQAQIRHLFATVW